jgi:hypothetical protein
VRQGAGNAPGPGEALDYHFGHTAGRIAGAAAMARQPHGRYRPEPLRARLPVASAWFPRMVPVAAGPYLAAVYLPGWPGAWHAFHLGVFLAVLPTALGERRRRR